LLAGLPVVVVVVVVSAGSAADVVALAADVVPVFGASDFPHAGTPTKTTSSAADKAISVEYLDDMRFPPFADEVDKLR